MIAWDKIRQEYENEDISLKALAEKYNLSPSTVRSRKNREDWQRNVATRRNATDAPGGQRSNKNAAGNSGGAPPKRNKNAFKHGLFAKIIPKESLKIAQELADSDPADILWNNIMIQYAAIIRAQEIMFVTDRDDLSKEESGWTSGDGGSSSTMQVQYAWDKQANFLKSQSRAMMTLSNLIKQFVSLADEQDERRKKLQLMDAQIAKLKATTPEAGDSDDEQIIIVDSWGDDE